jgi:hypothetical protein
VSQLQAFFEAGRIDFFQVEFARQALFSAQSRLLGTERGLQAALDNFKITLGLPPDIDIELEDDIIGPFQLVDPDIIPLQNGLTVLQQQAGQTMSRLFATAVEPALEKKKQSRSDDQQDESATDTPPSDDLVSDDDLQVDPSNSTERDGSADELPPAVAFQDGPAERFEPDEVNLDPPTLDWSPSVKKELTDLQQQLERTLDLLSEARDTHMDVARQDTERLKSAIQPRARIAALLKSQIRDRLERTRGGSANKVTETDIAALLPYDPSELNGLPKALNKTISQVGTELDDTERRLEKLISKIDSLLEGGDSLDPEELYEQIQTELRTSVPNELNEFSATILSLTLVQARARTESATLPTIELEWQQAIDQARTNRLDWMNARAQLVDTWRTIQFTARDLESQLDISLSGGIGNVGDNPLDIRWDSGRY